MKTNWKHLIVTEMLQQGERWSDIVASTFTDGAEVVEFDRGYGSAEGCAFTVWTQKRVYFPAAYDGSEWCASVARDPNGQPTAHIGGDE